VPVDVLDEVYDPGSLAATTPAPGAPAAMAAGPDAPVPDASAIAAAAGALARAESVVMIVGGGARRATHEVREVAERLDAPVITTVNGKGILPETHPLSLGAAI